jgi:hypothetical protein
VDLFARIIAKVVATFFRKRLFGYASLIYATPAIDMRHTQAIIIQCHCRDVEKVQDSSYRRQGARVSRVPYDVVAQCVDEQLRDIADMAPEVVPLTRSEYRHSVKDRIADLLEIAWLSGPGEDETGKLGSIGTLDMGAWWRRARTSPSGY